MPNKIGIKFFKSHFDQDMAKKVENVAALAYLADSRKKGGMFGGKEDLSRVVKIAIPFPAVKINGSKYAVFHGLLEEEISFPVTNILTPAQAREILNREDILAAIDEIEAKLSNPEATTITISGALNSAQVKAVKGLLSYKINQIEGEKVPVLIRESSIMDGTKKLKELLVHQERLRAGMEAVLQEIQTILEKKIKAMEDGLQKLKKENQAKLKQKETEIENRIKAKEQELEKKIKGFYQQANAENQKELKAIHSRVATNLTRDLEDLRGELKTALDLAKKVSDPKTGFDDLEKEFKVLQEKASIFNATINTALHTIDFERTNAIRKIEEAEAEEKMERTYFEREKEEIRHELVTLEEELKHQEQEHEEQIQEFKDRVALFNERVDEFLNIASGSNLNIDNIFVDGDLLGATTETKVTVYIPLWVGVFQKGSSRRLEILPPVNLPENLKKPKKYSIVSYGQKVIGFNPLAENYETLFNSKLVNALASEEVKTIIESAPNILEGTDEDQTRLISGIRALVTQTQASNKLSEIVNKCLIDSF